MLREDGMLPSKPQVDRWLDGDAFIAKAGQVAHCSLANCFCASYHAGFVKESVVLDAGDTKSRRRVE